MEQLFGITFTGRERMLLETADGSLDPVDRQRKYVLAVALAGIKCPACLAIICQRAATVGEFFSEERRHEDDRYECNQCHARLTYHLGLFAGQQWFELVPGQTIVVGKGPVTAAEQPPA
jgi:hypothetical protein